MRKFIILAGLLTAVGLLSGTPAKAWIGCQCVKLGAPAMCAKGPLECAARGGACLLPCTYVEPKAMKKRHHKKKM
jgi:hypothetical protein